MHLRPALLVVPVIALLKLSACSSDSAKELGAPDTPPGEGGPDASTDGQAPDVPYVAPCKVTKSAAPEAGRIIKGTLLLPGEPVEGELFIDDKGIIACAAASCSSTPGYAEAAVISCGKATISPGLINPHEHITFADNPPHKPSAERYEHRHDWRRGLRGHTEISVRDAKVDNTIEAAELRFAMTGVTSMASAGGSKGLVRNVDGIPAGLEGLNMTIANSDTFPLKDSSPKSFPTECSGFPAGRMKAEGITKFKGYLPHIAEGVDATARAEFTCQSDGEADPTHDLVRKQTAVVHGMAVNASDVARYRADQAALIWSPRSNIDLYGNTAPVVLYENLGVQIALGTDWLPSGSMNMARELRCADELNQKYFDKKFSDKQLWQMVTINAAFAIGANHAVGQLKEGYVADVAVFANQGKANPYRAVIEAGVEDVALVIRGGKVLYGDAEIASNEASGGGADCEDLDVCGVKKKACVKRDIGNKSLADLQAAASSIYPLFFCKKETPKDEPTCAPTRGPTKLESGETLKASSYSGITGTDKDGDGVADGEDNCPSVFNPIRPVDGDKQPDSDSDGIGDACDKCPLEDGEGCTPPSSDDNDGDGVANGVDDCPEIANPEQKGCSVVFTIAQLRNPAAVGHPEPGARAAVKGVWVTGVKDAGPGTFGYFIQESGTTYAGMFVATPGTKPTLKIGNKVDVEGDYEEVFGMSQLSNPVATVVDPGTTLPFGPVDVDPAVYAPPGAAGEPWEGMLCRIPGPVSVSAKNADAAAGQDHDEFNVIAGVNLRVDDNLYDPMDNAFEVGTSFPQIVGVCAFSFNNRKIWPRSQADIQ